MNPTPPTAQPVDVTIAPPNLTVVPGSAPAALTVSLRNNGANVDQFSVEIENLDPTWYTLEVDSVSLFPGDSIAVPVKIEPPRGAVLGAAQYNFLVRARSHTDPSLVGVARGTLQIGAYANVHAELSPRRITGYSGRFRLGLTNSGNQEAQIALAGSDPGGALSYTFKNAQPTVPAGAKLVVPVTVRSRGMRLFGDSQKHDFALTTRPVAGSDADTRQVTGEFVSKPLLGIWVLPVLGVLLALPVLALLLGWRPLGVSGATSTPVATVPTATATGAVVVIVDEPTLTPTGAPATEATETQVVALVSETPRPQPTRCDALRLMEHRGSRDTRFPAGVEGATPYTIGGKQYRYRAEYISALLVDRDGIISDVDVGRVDIFKPSTGGDQAFVAKLTSPSGRQVELFTWNCGQSGDVSMHVTLDDKRAETVPYACDKNFAGVFKPDPGPLSAFNGSQARGNWIMQVEAFSNTETANGFFNKWELAVCLK